MYSQQLNTKTNRFGLMLVLAFAGLIFSPCIASAGEFDYEGSWYSDTYGTGIYKDLILSKVDGNGNVYITGQFEGTVDFDSGAGIDQRTSSGTYDAFIQKNNKSGGYEWVRTIGGVGAGVNSSALKADNNGNVYLHGQFYGTVDFDPGAGMDEKTSWDYNHFVSKYNAFGEYQWTNVVESTTDIIPVYSSAVDASGNVYIAGVFSGSVDFDPSGGTNTIIGSYNNIFLSKYGANGSYQWTKSFSGSHYKMALQIGEGGSLYMAGSFSGSVDFDPGPGNDIHSSIGLNGDGFVSKYDLSGNLEWAKTFGGVDASVGNVNIETDQNENIYMVGTFERTVDFDPEAGVDNRTATGDQTDRPDVFISKYDSTGDYLQTQTFGGYGSDSLYSFSLDPMKNMYILGLFRGTVDFDPGPGEDLFNAAPGYSVFLTRYDASGKYHWTKIYEGEGGEVEFLNGGALQISNWTLYISGALAHSSATADLDLNEGTDYFSADDWTDPLQFLSRYSLNPLSLDYPGPSPTPDSTPTFTFTLPSCASGNLQYRIEIDDDPVFGSPTVDYTSGPKDTGNNFFTVGQPEGTGTYAVGSEGQELPYGTYFWRVYSICNSDPSPPDDGDPITIEPAVSTSGVGTTLDINSTIAIACDPSVTMNALVGTGRSTIDENNRADCTVITNNSAGYALSWQASTDDLLNAQSDHFAAYTPASSTTPETWDIPNTTSAWGAKLAATSEGYNGGAGGSGYTYPGTGWGSDDSYGSGLWLNVAASEPFQFMQKATETDVDGEVQSLMFGAEIGADKIQPTGTYTTNVTVTAVTLSGGGGGGGGPTPPDGVDGDGYTYYNAEYGDTINGTLDNGDYYDGDYYYEKILFPGSAGDQVTFDASWLASTGYLILLDENYDEVGDDGDWNNPASGTFGAWTLPTTGTYTLYVSTYDPNETGDYSVTIHPPL